MARKLCGWRNTTHCLPRDGDASITKPSDIFALGSTLYEIIQGVTPYEGKLDEEVEKLYIEQIFPSVEDEVWCP